MLLRKDFLFEIKKNIYEIFILKKQRKSKALEGGKWGEKEREPNNFLSFSWLPLSAWLEHDSNKNWKNLIPIQTYMITNEKKIFFQVETQNLFIYFSPLFYAIFSVFFPYSGLVLGSTKAILCRKETSFLWNQPIFSVWLCWIVRQCYLLFLSLPLTLMQNSTSQCYNVQQEQWKAKHFSFLFVGVFFFLPLLM